MRVKERERYKGEEWVEGSKEELEQRQGSRKESVSKEIVKKRINKKNEVEEEGKE